MEHEETIRCENISPGRKSEVFSLDYDDSGQIVSLSRDEIVVNWKKRGKKTHKIECRFTDFFTTDMR